MDTIRIFAISKLGWIKQQQQKLREQERESPREYLDRESHYVWGRRYLLQVMEKDAAPSVELMPNRLLPRVRLAASEAKKQAILDGWYREPLLGVQVEQFLVRRMKTRWGSCSPALSRR